MATCGYICPSCGGSGTDPEGKDCEWCIPDRTGLNQDKKSCSSEDSNLEEWIREVHEGKCCSD